MHTVVEHRVQATVQQRDAAHRKAEQQPAFRVPRLPPRHHHHHHPTSPQTKTNIGATPSREACGSRVR